MKTKSLELLRETSRRNVSRWFASFLLIASLGAESEAFSKGSRKGQKKKASGPTLNYEYFRKKIEFKVYEKREEQITGIKRLLELNPSDKEVADLRFRLAELYYEKSRFYFFRGQEAEDVALASKNSAKRKASQKEKTQHLKESQAWAKRATSIYRDIRDNYPNYKRLPEVLFALGQSYWSNGKFKTAIKVYAELIRGFKEHPLVAEAWIAFGEFYFSEGNLKKALRSYEKAAENKRSRVYGFALYKQGWCYYNMKEWKKALRKFKGTVLYSQLSEELAGENKIALGREAQKDYVRTYSHIGDPKRAKFVFADLLGKDDCRGEGCLTLLEQLSGLWFDEGYFDEAALLYKQLIRLGPERIKNPYYQGRVVDLVSRSGDKEATIRETRVLVELYQAARDKVSKMGGGEKAEDAREAVREAEQTSEATIRRLAQIWNREAKKTRNEKTYEYARTMYVDYLKLFSGSKHAYAMKFQLADLYYKLEAYDQAAIAYKETVLAQPEKGAHLVDAANDNILAIEEHVKDLRIKKPTPSDTPLEFHPQKQRILEACKRFVAHVPAKKGKKQLVRVKYKAARVYYEYSHYDEAIRRFDDIVRTHPSSEQAEYSANLVVDILNIRKDWKELYSVSRKYLGIRSLIKGREKLEKDLREGAEYGKFALVQAEEQAIKSRRGDLRLVAKSYEEFYDEFPTSENADKALYNASINFDKVGQKEKANKLRRVLLTKFKKSPLAVDVAFYVAKSYEQRTQYRKAAKAFLSFHKKYAKQDKRSRDALYNAAVFYAGVGAVKKANKLRRDYLEKYGRSRKAKKEAAAIYYAIARDLDLANKRRSAAKRYAEFAKQFPRSDLLWKALSRESKLRRKMKQKTAAEKIESQILGTYHYRLKKGRKMPAEALRYASQVAFRRVDQEYSDYRKLKIKSPNLRNPRPFKRSLEMKARGRQRMLRRYTQVVTRYKEAESTVASLYGIARSWDDFVKSLMSVSCPRGVNEETCMFIKQGIEAQAAPARESAYAAYKSCVDKSNELNTFTRYSTKCVKALEESSEAQYPPIVEKFRSYRPATKRIKISSNNMVLADPSAPVKTDPADAEVKK